MMDKFNEFYMMQNQAKKLEQSGLEDKALELYLKIIAEYLPNNDFSFDRAATILEKKFKYPEAIGICEKAMEKIKAADIQGDPAKFQLKIDRMRQKAQSDSQFQSAADKGPPEEFHFGLPGFRTANKLIMVAGSAYYALIAYSSYPDQLYTFLFLLALAFVGSYGLETMMKLANNKTCTKALSVTLITLIIAGFSAAQIPQVKVYWAADGTQQSEEEGEKTGDGQGTGATEPLDTDREPPTIPEKYLEATAKAADKHPATEQALITAQPGEIQIDLIVKPGTSHKSIEEIADDMLRTLGGLMTSEKLKGPTDESLGELYYFYGVTLTVTDSLEQLVDEGTLARQTDTIKWTKP